jgi:hypothetical protein
VLSSLRQSYCNTHTHTKKRGEKERKKEREEGEGKESQLADSLSVFSDMVDLYFRVNLVLL